MYEVSAQVLSVTGKNTTKGTVYEIAMSDGVKYQTWDANVASKAQGLQGQVVAARVNHQQNSKNGRTYDNYYLEDVGLPGTLAPLAAPAAGPVVVGAPAPVAAPAAQIPMQAPPISDAERQKLIVRQSVLSTAFAFVSKFYGDVGPEGLEEATIKANELASALYAKVFGTGGAQAAPVAVPTTAAEVAAVVPGVQVGTEGVEQPVAAAAPVPEF